MGLFAYNSGTIKRLNVSVSGNVVFEDAKNDMVNSSNSFIGCISAVNAGSIEDCTIQGSLSASYTGISDIMSIGSITGYNSGDIPRCWSSLSLLVEGSFTGSGARARTVSIGGIVGENSGLIHDCMNSGMLTAIMQDDLTVMQMPITRLYGGGIAGISEYGEITGCIQAANAVILQ